MTRSDSVFSRGPNVPSTTTQRLEAFSDGVIAIAITLLVLTLEVPKAKSGGLFDALVDDWTSFAAFILSFVVIGIMWVSHHSMFERIVTVDRPLMFLNLLLLLGIAFLPFPTSLTDSEAPQTIDLAPSDLFEVTEPYGVDTFFLLTSDEPIPNPWLLE